VAVWPSIAYHFAMIPRALRLLVLVVASLAPLASTHAASTVFLEELTWTELRAEIAAGRTTILVPVGGTEQNGPHMVLGKHNVRVRALAARIAAELGNALVAPVVAYVPEGAVDPPASHMRFPGTITVPDDTFVKVLESAGRSFRVHGFRNVVFLGDHGGYQKDLRLAADRLNREWAGTPVRALALDAYYRVTETTYRKALQERGFADDEIGTHAGLADTSLMLALDPRLVRSERLQAGDRLGSAEGVYGDPRRASAELGQLGVDAIVSATVEAIRRDAARR
jgi:creatinine amidohydrolase/Fe(II)-dependent formamide hydrolase-like protein